MGHRANYAIRKDGDVELFYSHWGALNIPENFFWGPSYSEDFIRSHDRRDVSDWLDDAWGEGGVALDFDERVVTLFGGEALGHPPLRATFAGLMAALWAADDWDVVWAPSGMSSIAEAVGVDPSVVTSDPIPPFAADLDALGESFATDEPNFGCLVSVVHEAEVSHYVSDSGVSSTLFAGPDLLEHLGQLVDLERALELWEKPDFRGGGWGLGDELSHSAIVDLDRQVLSFRDAFAERTSSQFFSDKWAGWSVEKFDGPIDRHFERLSLELPHFLIPLEKDRSDPLEVELTEEAALAEVAKYLIDTRRKDPSEIVRKMEHEARKHGSDVVMNPAARQPLGQVPLDSARRQALFGRAIALWKYMP